MEAASNLLNVTRTQTLVYGQKDQAVKNIQCGVVLCWIGDDLWGKVWPSGGRNAGFLQAGDDSAAR